MMEAEQLKGPMQSVAAENYDISGSGLVQKLLAVYHVHITRWQLAISLLLITWFPLALLTFIDGTFNGGVQLPFIMDYSRQSRLLLGIPLLVLIHEVVYRKIPMVLQYITEVLILPGDRQQFISVTLRKSKSYSNSAWVQGVMILLIFGLALSPIGGGRFFEANGGEGSWIMSADAGTDNLSRAGRWMQYVSIPVFQFLFARWVWRYGVWVALLYRISRMNLRLHPSHPDGAGGLGILVLAQRNFNVFFFVCGLVISGNMVASFQSATITFDTVKIEILGFILLTLLVIFFPMLFFTGKLIMTKYQGNLYLGKAGLHASELFEEEWVKGMAEKQQISRETVDPSMHADYTGVYRYLQGMSIVPIRLSDIILISIVQFLPFIPVFFMHFSIIELMEKILGLLV
jgi:hypothetical protein